MLFAESKEWGTAVKKDFHRILHECDNDLLTPSDLLWVVAGSIPTQCRVFLFFSGPLSFFSLHFGLFLLSMPV